MRKINKIIVHCSATPKGKHFSAETIKSWHLERGFSDIGYHYIVHLDGTMEYGRMVDVQGAHCKGENKYSIGVCYIGGMDQDMKKWEDTRTEEQRATLVDLLSLLKKFHPKAEIYGHRDFSTKMCPSYDAKEEYKYIV
jgi:N-acetylmuramoyl-L-alanine amidase